MKGVKPASERDIEFLNLDFGPKSSFGWRQTPVHESGAPTGIVAIGLVTRLRFAFTQRAPSAELLQTTQVILRRTV